MYEERLALRSTYRPSSQLDKVGNARAIIDPSGTRVLLAGLAVIRFEALSFCVRLG